MPEKMKLFGSGKRITDKTKGRKNFPSLEEVLVLVQCKLVDNQYQQKSQVIYMFALNKSYVYLLNNEPSNLVFLKTYNTDFDKIFITFTDQNDRLLEIEDKFNLTLLTNK